MCSSSALLGDLRASRCVERGFLPILVIYLRISLNVFVVVFVADRAYVKRSYRSLSTGVKPV